MSIISAPSQTNQRLSIRTTSSCKAEIQRAARLRGQTLTEFVLATALEAAERTIKASVEKELSAVGSAAFAKALLHPMPAHPRLEQAAKGYAERYEAV